MPGSVLCTGDKTGIRQGSYPEGAHTIGRWQKGDERNMKQTKGRTLPLSARCRVWIVAWGIQLSKRRIRENVSWKINVFTV